MLLQFGFGLNFDAADITNHAGVRVSSVEVAKVQIATPKLRKSLARAMRALVDLLAAMHSVVDLPFVGCPESLAASFVLADERSLVTMNHHVHVKLGFVAEALTAAENKKSIRIHFSRFSYSQNAQPVLVRFVVVIMLLKLVLGAEDFEACRALERPVRLRAVLGDDVRLQMKVRTADFRAFHARQASVAAPVAFQVADHSTSHREAFAALVALVDGVGSGNWRAFLSFRLECHFTGFSSRKRVHSRHLLRRLQFSFDCSILVERFVFVSTLELSFHDENASRMCFLVHVGDFVLNDLTVVLELVVAL